MGRLSDTYANAILDMAFSKATNPFPATLYVGLSSTLPANDGTNVTEPTDPSYARVAVTNNATNWPAASARSKSNANVIMFPIAISDWLVASYWVIYSAATSGTMIAWGALETPMNITAGYRVAFPAGAITINAPGA